MKKFLNAVFLTFGMLFVLATVVFAESSIQISEITQNGRDITVKGTTNNVMGEIVTITVTDADGTLYGLGQGVNENDEFALTFTMPQRAGMGTYNISVGESDLYQYLDDGEIFKEGGWNRRIIPWTEFLPYSGSAFDANLTLDLDLVSSIQLGFNKRGQRDPNISFKIKNIGGYYQKESVQATNIKNVLPEDGAVISGTTLNISAEINGGIVGYEAESLKVFVDDVEILYSLNGKNLTATAEVSKGAHQIKIKLNNKYNKVYTALSTIVAE